MDAKKQIRADFTQGDGVEEECIDISIAKTPATLLFLVLQRGLSQTADDINAMVELHGKLPEGDQKKNIGMQLRIAKLAYDQANKFAKELEAINKELEIAPAKPLIIKPKFGGNFTTQ